MRGIAHPLGDLAFVMAGPGHERYGFIDIREVREWFVMGEKVLLFSLRFLNPDKKEVPLYSPVRPSLKVGHVSTWFHGTEEQWSKLLLDISGSSGDSGCPIFANKDGALMGMLVSQKLDPKMSVRVHSYIIQPAIIRREFDALEFVQQ